MPLLVTSANGANGDGLGALLAFDSEGGFLGAFSKDSRISDPRGLAVNRNGRFLLLNSGSDRVLALDSGGTVVRDTGQIEGFEPRRRDFRAGRSLLRRLAQQAHRHGVLRSQLDADGELFLPAAIVPFPRGFAFGHDGRFFLASGIGPNGVGDNAIVAFDPGERTAPVQLVSDPELSPLDLTIAPNGNVVVSSEHPFGASDAVTSVREYDAQSGELVRIFSAGRLGRISQAARSALWA